MRSLVSCFMVAALFGSSACASRQRIRVESRYPKAEMRYVTIGVDGKRRLSPVHPLPHEIELVTEAPAKNGLIAFGVGAGVATAGAGIGVLGFVAALGDDRGTGSGVAIFSLGATLFVSGVVTSLLGLAFGIAEGVAEDQAIGVEVRMRAPGVARRKRSIPLPVRPCPSYEAYCLRLRYGPPRRSGAFGEAPAESVPSIAPKPAAPTPRTAPPARRSPILPRARTSTAPGMPRLW